MLKINAQFIARSLKGKRAGAGFVAHCPSHDDRNPSLSITEAKDGRMLFKCHAGCTQEDVLQALGELGLWPTREEREATPKSITYTYVDENGIPLHRTIRTAEKRFWQEHLKAGAWIRGCGPRVVLYHLDELTQRRNETVCICEGEKDVDRLRSLGCLATCNPMGAGKWREWYADTLSKRNTVIFYDNDSAANKRVGQTHANDVALSLCAVGCKIRIIDLPWGKDVSDFLDTGGTKEALERLIAEAQYVGVNEICHWRAGFDAGTQVPGSAENCDVGWPEPILLTEDPVEPLRPDILRGDLGEYSRALARFTETPVELPVLAVLGVLSTAAAGKVEIEAEPGYIESVNLYVCPVLESGNRKTAVVQRATKVLAEYETGERERLRPEIAQLESERKTKEVVIDKLRKKLKDADSAEIQRIADLEADLPVVPRPPILFTADVTAERLEVLLEANAGRLAVISDEGGIFDVIAGRYNTTPNLDVWLKGHSQGHVRVHRMERATLVDKPHLTVLISPQPAVLSGLRDKEFMRGRGLLARFLFALPPSPVGNRKLLPCHMPARVTAEYHELITRVLDWRPEEPRILRLSPEAYAAWKEFQRSTERQMADGERLCRLRDWASKLPGAALRIAGLLHVARLSRFLAAVSLELEESDMQIAIEICTTLTSHAIAVFGIVSEDPILTHSKRLMRWISDQQKSEISKRECFRAHRPHLFGRVEEMDACLRILAEHHLIRVVERKTGGRPSEVIEVNPALKEGQ
jgi:putative DNA primase/helicase